MKQAVTGACVRLTPCDREEISELRKQLASAPPLAGEALLSEQHQHHARLLRRMSHFGRRTSTPLRELFQHQTAASLPVAAGVGDAADPQLLGTAAAAQPVQPPSALADNKGTNPAVLSLAVRPAKRKSDADTVLERVGAEGALDSPSKRRRTSLLASSGRLQSLSCREDPADAGSPQDQDLDHRLDPDLSLMEESTALAKDDDDELDADDQNEDHDAAPCEEDGDAGAPTQYNIGVPSAGALFDALTLSSSVETRAEKREGFLRRTFSVKKLKAGPLATNSDPRFEFVRVIPALLILLVAEQEVTVCSRSPPLRSCSCSLNRTSLLFMVCLS